MKIRIKTVLVILWLLIPGCMVAQRGWQKMSTNIVKDLNDVFFIDSLEGWVVGNSGTILHTVDGGIHWEIQQEPTSNFLQGIWFSDESTGWIIGNIGTLLKTNDKGESWSAANFLITEGLNDIMFCNALNGWIVGDLGIIIHTSDGGEKWQYQFAGVEQNLLSVSFSDVNNGWIAGSYNNGWLSHTQNGGIEWVDFPLPMQDLTYSVCFTSPYRGWVGSDSKVLFTDDVGETWSEQLLPAGAGYVSDLFFVNDTIGWALTEKQIYYTGNAGTTWDLQLVAENGGTFSALYFTDEQHGWITGRNGLVYATTDGGGTGFRETDLWDKMVLFPNPASGNLHIRLKDRRYFGAVFTIELIDMAGRLLFSEMSPVYNELVVPVEGMKGPVTIRVSLNDLSGSRVVIIP
jgi:photosystem II stability/assembly factor-like uncharacterized protein